MAAYSEAEREALKLLRRSFSWSVSMDRRSRLWVATYAGECIRRDTPLGLFDVLTLAARARRADYRIKGLRELTGTEQGDSMACNCCHERLEQLAVVLHEANAQILALLEEARKELAELAALAREARRYVPGGKVGE
jgi:hypothetical protein